MMQERREFEIQRREFGLWLGNGIRPLIRGVCFLDCPLIKQSTICCILKQYKEHIQDNQISGMKIFLKINPQPGCLNKS